MSNEKEFEQTKDNDIVMPEKPHFPPTIKPQDLLPKNSNSNKPCRIPNAFIAYRIAFCQGLKSQNICITMPDVSSLASDFWAHEPIHVKATYKKIANEAKLLYDKQSSSNDNKEELKKVNFKESKKSKKSSSVVVETKNENMEFTTTTTTTTTTATPAENLNSEFISSQIIYHPQHIQESNFHNYAYDNYNYNDYNNNYNYDDYNDYNKYNYNNNYYYNNDNYNNNYYNYNTYDNQISPLQEDDLLQRIPFIAYSTYPTII